KTFAGGWHIVRKIFLHLLQLCLNFSIPIGANGHPCLLDVRRPSFVGAGHGSLQDWGVTRTHVFCVDVVSRSARRYDQEKRYGSDADANGFRALISVAGS